MSHATASTLTTDLATRLSNVINREYPAAGTRLTDALKTLTLSAFAAEKTLQLASAIHTDLNTFYGRAPGADHRHPSTEQERVKLVLSTLDGGTSVVLGVDPQAQRISLARKTGVLLDQMESAHSEREKQRSSEAGARAEEEETEVEKEETRERHMSDSSERKQTQEQDQQEQERVPIGQQSTCTITPLGVGLSVLGAAATVAGAAYWLREKYHSK